MTCLSSSVGPAMDFRYTPDEAAFRAEVQAWLDEHLTGEFAALGSSGGPADETGWDVRIEWERVLGAHRWVGMSWPAEYGGPAPTVPPPGGFVGASRPTHAPPATSFCREGPSPPTLI